MVRGLLLSADALVLSDCLCSRKYLLFISTSSPHLATELLVTDPLDPQQACAAIPNQRRKPP